MIVAHAYTPDMSLNLTPRSTDDSAHNLTARFAAPSDDKVNAG